MRNKTHVRIYYATRDALLQSLMVAQCPRSAAAQRRKEAFPTCRGVGLPGTQTWL